MAGEVAAGELGERLLALHGRGLAQPVAHEHVGVLATMQRTADHEALHGGQEQQVQQGLALAWNTRGDQPFA